MSSTTTTTALTSTKLIGMLPTMTKATTLMADKTRPSSRQNGTGTGTASNQSSDEQQRLKDLEAQVRNMNVNATQMERKIAEYEEEIRRLRSQGNSNGAPYTPNGSAASPTSSRPSHDIDRSLSPTQLSPHSHCPQQQQQQQQQQQGRLSTLASYLPYRRSSATPPTSSHSVPAPGPAPATAPSPVSQLPYLPGPETLELQNALNREQDLRRAAETQLTQAHSELEELTVQLFSQANEMVAQERKARARLEERVAVLERRDVEKRNRLDRLEKAMARVERIRNMVG